jgi:hypothetical protein
MKDWPAYPTALLAPDTTRKLWQVSSLARHRE